jgi:uncharacterized protein YecE (DUF72 family)
MSQYTQGKLWIGTSNITLPGNKTTFPAAFHSKSRLNYYSTLFNSVELNNTFYKIPLSSTFEKWSNDVEPDFRFSVKLWKSITHVKELAFNEDDIETFVKRANFLLDKKGCILLQFPGKITLEYFNKVEEILKVITSSDDTGEWNKAVELRNASWHTGETFELLNEYNASMVLHDFPKGKIAEVTSKADFVYVRFHGPTGNYKGSYSYEFLSQKAVQIKEWLSSGKDVYAYFNNTAGDAYQNAHTLKELCGV